MTQKTHRSIREIDPPIVETTSAKDSIPDCHPAAHDLVDRAEGSLTRGASNQTPNE